MARYYFYSADLYYDAKSADGEEVRRVGDYQGVYAVDEDTTAPDRIFQNLMEGLKSSIPPELGEDAYYHVTQFNNLK